MKRSVRGASSLFSRCNNNLHVKFPSCCSFNRRCSIINSMTCATRVLYLIYTLAPAFERAPWKKREKRRRGIRLLVDGAPVRLLSHRSNFPIASRPTASFGTKPKERALTLSSYLWEKAAVFTFFVAVVVCTFFITRVKQFVFPALDIRSLFYSLFDMFTMFFKECLHRAFSGLHFNENRFIQRVFSVVFTLEDYKLITDGNLVNQWQIVRLFWQDRDDEWGDFIAPTRYLPRGFVR